MNKWTLTRSGAILLISAAPAISDINENCFPLANVDSNAPLECPISPLNIGDWRLEAVTDVTAFGSVNGQRAYASRSLGGATFNATLDPLDCTGTIEVNLLESGRSFTLSEVTESTDDTAQDHARLIGRTTVQPALNMRGNVEIRASGRDSGILSLTVDSAAFADVARGGVVMSMNFDDVQGDIHPYCDCRTQLRTYLDEKVAFYENILAGYENTSLWTAPEGLNPDIEYEYATYNQFQLMMNEGRLSQDEIIACFNAQFDEMTPQDLAEDYVGSYFKPRGRAGAVTDPTTCSFAGADDASGTCYPDIVNGFETAHEEIHQSDCEAVRKPLSASAGHSAVFNFITATKPQNFDNEVADPSNPEPQALAENEIRAYYETISYLRAWEATNCGG